MSKGRLEAFSDGVIAILITIMVLELRVPKGQDLADLRSVFPVLCNYLLSFVFLGIYWNNHHHMFQAVQSVKGGVLWANSGLLFWLSLVPFTTAWMGQHPWAPWPIATYGVNLLLCAIAYTILVRSLVAHHGPDSRLAVAVGSDFKGKISLVLYIASIPIAFYHPVLSYACFIAVAILWLVPDRRMERVLDMPAAGPRR
jgi:uncharacterized membrane protein